ncbi:MAG: MFS transporter [Candidatus Accumulibacter sp.]|jgi:PPP family 3-phenylpropionic acid transporter|uniref:MFS transporter n=1 Tax=unclassified Candidatus Accumulibacter TaxID=2619054 RepID=UPI001A644C14|nr:MULTISPECIES: MFS transporter [unclassified Candidatus Accumulibacter]MBL8366706.1 MFS transporter [Accumulibacter sp.]MBN8513032.1 MFS transporter [Accumulibacter sp.]HRI92862.1 MFS transporter [Accumulibacter sp.]
MQALPYWRLSGYYFFYFAFIGAFSPYFGLYLQSLSFSAWDIGLLMSQMQLMRLFAPYLWGALADRMGQRVGIVRLAGVVSLIGFASFFVVRSFEAMLLAMALLAFFWSAALPLVETLTFDHLREQPARYSRIRLWGSIGFIVAVMGTGALLDQLPLSALLWVIAATLAGIMIYALAVPEAPSHGATGAQVPVGEILRQRRVKALFAACLAMSAAHGAFYVFYSIHLADHHYSKFAVGCLWSLGVLAEIVVFFFMVGLLRRFGLRTILLASFAAAIARFLVIGWGVESVPLIVVAQLLHGLTFGAYHATAIAAVNRWFPGRCQARGQALYSSLSFGAGGLLGSLLSGWSWDAWGAGPTYTMSSAFALFGLLFVAVGVKSGDLDDPGGSHPAPIAGFAHGSGGKE